MMMKAVIFKINSILFLIIATVAIFYLGAGFLKPLVFGFFFATLMWPVAIFLEKKGLPRMLAALICASIVYLTVSGLLVLVVSQLGQFAESLPEIGDQLEELLAALQQSVANMTGISPERQASLFEERSEGLAETIQAFVQGFLTGFFTTLGHFFLTNVYLFLLLTNRSRIKTFILDYSGEKKEKAKSVINKSATVSHHYLWGRIKVMSILGGLYLVAFLSFDVRFALLFTVVGALLTIIPYIGPLLSGVIPVAFTLVEGEDYSYILFFAAVVLVIQLIESYILEPLIIGDEVNLAPLYIIIAIIIGGMLWGILGMILFVPLFAIFRIIAEHTPKMQPIAKLISNK
ncbi:AI-2E family transporter [Litoribacter ruber]|uniref:AI-2E family transporter n=1 Tax=Litoribacter ruber TaxID=702568 RepID=A0AAP2CJ37_9BACT|nr:MULTISPECIES: AI-2E family transporter [Litoribacter]MBS9522717.1 AI-2E family transporter [Litoribacter alkaliphilus]MBT0811247.1 AI-2E family transporter [Litoribacter ruber]